MEDFRDKVAVITGGATGIGFGLAKALGADGAKIVIGEPRQDRLDEAVAALTAEGIEARATVCDVRDLASVEALADFAWDAFGQVDLVFNNAGVGLGQKRLVNSEMAAVRNLFEVNFWGVWHGCKVFGERLIKQGTPAAIYNTGSENSLFVAVPANAAYVASKHAVLGLTDSLDEEMPDFIRVGVIIPGFVRSEMTTGPFADVAMTADDFAEIILKQVRAGERYCVSHPYNIERVEERMAPIRKAYDNYAPRYEGDEEHDVRTLIEKVRGKSV
ncbi:MAG: SDR family NAD(P)-dependent oxidoreductase [Pseudomonadota bacterium]